MSADDLATRGKATAERVAAEKRNNHAVQRHSDSASKTGRSTGLGAARATTGRRTPHHRPTTAADRNTATRKQLTTPPSGRSSTAQHSSSTNPDTVPALWGDGTEVLWAEDESLMIAGPMGLGKTTLAVLLMHAQLGVGDGTVLGLPVAERPRQDMSQPNGVDVEHATRLATLIRARYQAQQDDSCLGLRSDRHRAATLPVLGLGLRTVLG